MAAAIVRWESMKLFDPTGFARFDLINDDIYPSNMSNSEQQKLRDLTLARSKNNALLALRWRPKKPTATQLRAHKHGIEDLRPLSDFKLAKRVSLASNLTAASVYLLVLPTNLAQIVYSNGRATGLSRLETLPSSLLRRISLLLDDEVDQVCLSLTSKVLAASMRQLWARPHRCPGCGGCHSEDDEYDDRTYSWFDLAMRIEDSMPESMQFCHHCLVFLPKSSFATAYPLAEIDTLIRRDALACFDCLRLTDPRLQYDDEDCDGCEILQIFLDVEDDDEAQDEGDACSPTNMFESSMSEMEDVSHKPSLPNAGAGYLCM